MNGPEGFSRLTLLRWMELVLVVVCVTGSAVLCNYIVYRHNRRFDLTPERRYTLSGQTMGVLGGIDTDLQATVFYGPQDRQSLKDLLELFSRATPRFHYDFVDLEKNPARAGGMEIKGFGAGVVTYKGRREKVQYCTEDSLLSAIIRLTEPGQKIIRFVQGHGEKEISGTDQKTSYSSVRQALIAENYTVEDLMPLQAGRIPDDTLVLVISGPQKDFLPREIDMLDAYLRSGGRVLLQCDPFPLPTIEAYLRHLQIQLSRDFIIDTQSRLIAFDDLTPVIIPQKEHPITRYLHQAVVFPLCRPVLPIGSGTGEIIASSSPGSWAERNTRSAHDGRARFDREDDLRGPVPVAVALQGVGGTDEGQGGRLVVMGNSSFASNYYLHVIGNKDFFQNTINWIADTRRLMVPRTGPAQAPVSMFFLTERQSGLVFWSAVVAQPALVLCLGILVVVWRRVRR
jgi:ABC-type uncharacterized transport system involved in gliding motility auxiliary subunit